MPFSDEAKPCQSYRAKLAWLWVLAGLIGILLGAVAQLSLQFEYSMPTVGRPLVAVVTLLAIATACYLVAIPIAVRIPEGWQLFQVIWIPALLFRLILLFSEPIQEVDLYRYMWDGSVSCEGVSPFRYSPKQILEARNEEDLPADVARLVRMREQFAGKREILERVHFAELRTVYPPVSQLFFATAMWMTPDDATLRTHRWIMKSMLVIMDIMTIVCVWFMLTRIGFHRGWTLVYAWCPLLLKEIANSGHLDAIVVALTTVAVLCLVRYCNDPTRRRLLVSVAFLALATAAKLYPVVLLPLWIRVAWQRNGSATAIASGGIYVVLCGLLMYPMLGPSQPDRLEIAQRSDASSLALPIPEPFVEGQDTAVDDQGATVDDQGATGVDRGSIPPRFDESEMAPSGLTAFLSRWEMNDVIFLVILENVRPDRPDRAVAWFVVIPNSVRIQMASVGRFFGCEQQPTAFYAGSWMYVGDRGIGRPFRCAARPRKPSQRHPRRRGAHDCLVLSPLTDSKSMVLAVGTAVRCCLEESSVVARAGSPARLLSQILV